METKAKPNFGVIALNSVAGLAAVCVVLLQLRTTHMGRASDSQSEHRQIVLGQASDGFSYAVTISVSDLTQLQNGDSVHVTVADASGPVSDKWLHAADLDFYFTLKARARGAVTARGH